MQGEMDRGVPQRDNCRMYVHHPSPPPVPLHVPTASREDALTVRRVRPDFGDECQTLRMRCTKRSALGPLFGAPHPSQPPTAVSRRNARERKRVRLVNMGFATLRDHVPSGVKNKKLSKVETLRSAIEYIKQLQELLGDKDSHSFEEMARDFYDASQGSPGEGFESSHATLFEEESSEDIPMIPVNNNAAKEPIFSSSPASSMASDYSSSSPYATHPSEEFIDIGSWFS